MTNTDRAQLAEYDRRKEERRKAGHGWIAAYQTTMGDWAPHGMQRYDTMLEALRVVEERHPDALDYDAVWFGPTGSVPTVSRCPVCREPTSRGTGCSCDDTTRQG
jgi:hypothetical protein